MLMPISISCLLLLLLLLKSVRNCQPRHDTSPALLLITDWSQHFG